MSRVWEISICRNNLQHLCIFLHKLQSGLCIFLRFSAILIRIKIIILLPLASCWSTFGRLRYESLHMKGGQRWMTDRIMPLWLAEWAEVNWADLEFIKGTAWASADSMLAQVRANYSGCGAMYVWETPESITQCLFDVGPPSTTLAQHQTSIGWTTGSCT